MTNEWENRMVKVQDILDICEKAADVNRKLAQQIMDRTVDGKADVTLLDAYAWFIKEERKFRYDIPEVIREAVCKGGDTDDK